MYWELATFWGLLCNLEAKSMALLVIACEKQNILNFNVIYNIYEDSVLSDLTECTSQNPSGDDRTHNSSIKCLRFWVKQQKYAGTSWRKSYAHEPGALFCYGEDDQSFKSMFI